MFFRVKQYTTEYILFMKMIESRSQWFTLNNRVKLEKLLGISIDGNLYPTERHLIMAKPPANMISMFKLINGLYRAKDNIKLNRDYILLCKELGLKEYSAIEFSVETELISLGGGNVFHFYDGECFVAAPSQANDISTLFTWLEPIEVCDLVEARERSEEKNILNKMMA